MLSTKGAWAEWGVLAQVVPYLRPYKKLMSLSVAMTIAVSAFALLEPWPLAVIIDSVLGNHPPPSVLQPFFGANPDRYTLLGFIVAAGFLQVIFSHGFTVLNDYVNAKVELNMVLDVRSRLFDHCQKLSQTFHDKQMTGKLMSQINIQAASIGEVVMAFPPLAQSLLTLIGMLAIALLFDWQVTLVALVALPFLYYSIGVYGTKIVPRVRQVQGLEWRSLSIVFEAMSMLPVIVGFGRQRYEHRRFREQAQTAVDARVRLTVWQTAFSLMVSTATALGTALVLGFGAIHAIQGKITIGQLYILISYVASVYQPLEAISTTLGDLNRTFVYVNAALSLLDEEPEVDDAPDAIDIDRARGELTFENVNFAYEGRVDTLKDVSFKIEAGQRVAIVGPTGAGKTTLASLIVRYYDYGEGDILVDGIDIRKISLESLRKQISLVPQEPLLFSGTIAENIRYGRLDATMEEVIEAAKAANSHDFISRLPDGYQTELGERGAQLSGGERQRICVARAFVRNAPILILDEPTSSIDSKTESVILDALDRLMVGRTSLMIAHRLSTIRDADIILVVNDGEVVEQGTHGDLVALGGLYAQLHQAQTRQRRPRPGAPGTEQEAPGPAAPAGGAPEALPGIDVPPPDPDRAPEPEPLEKHPGPPLPSFVDGNGDEPAIRVPAGGGNGHSAADGHGNGRKMRVVKIGDARSERGCDLCGRMLLRGESTATYLIPRGQRREPRHVCELCWVRAEEEGWTLAPSR
jgi:ABC-type multidrug transport system fused ATPase/permease subunit